MKGSWRVPLKNGMNFFKTDFISQSTLFSNFHLMYKDQNFYAKIWDMMFPGYQPRPFWKNIPRFVIEIGPSLLKSMTFLLMLEFFYSLKTPEQTIVYLFHFCNSVLVWESKSNSKWPEKQKRQQRPSSCEMIINTRHSWHRTELCLSLLTSP